MVVSKVHTVSIYIQLQSFHDMIAHWNWTFQRRLLGNKSVSDYQHFRIHYREPFGWALRKKCSSCYVLARVRRKLWYAYHLRSVQLVERIPVILEAFQSNLFWQPHLLQWRLTQKHEYQERYALQQLRKLGDFQVFCRSGKKLSIQCFNLILEFMNKTRRVIYIILFVKRSFNFFIILHSTTGSPCTMANGSSKKARFQVKTKWLDLFDEEN